MLRKLYAVIAVIGAIISGFITTYFIGKKRGKEIEETKNVIEVTKAYNEAKKQIDKVDTMPDSVAREQLREFTKDN